MIINQALFVARNLAEPGSSGIDTMILDFCRYLKSVGFEITYLFLGMSRPISPELESIAKVVIGNQQPPHYDSPATEGECRITQWVFERINPEIVVANYSWIAAVHDYLDWRSWKIILVPDLRIRVLADFEKHGFHHHHHQWTEAEESECLQKADLIVTIQEQDRLECLRMTNGTSVVRVNLSSELNFTDESLQHPGRIFYVASGVRENCIAIERFLENCWSTIRRYSIGATLHIAGNVCNGINVGQYQGVKLLGRVEDLTQEYAETRVCIVPTFHGGGSKLKFIAALSHGKAVVANTHGIDGFEETSGYCAIITDSPDEFAMAVVSVLQDGKRRKQFEANARTFASERLPTDKAYSNLTDELNRRGLL